jgi:putative membrane protein
MEHAHLFGTHGHWFWIVPILFMIVMMVLWSFGCRRMGGWRRRPAYAGRGRFDCCGAIRDPRSSYWPETPAQILDRRYASGEITKEQREQMKRELDSSLSQNGMEAE